MNVIKHMSIYFFNILTEKGGVNRKTFLNVQLLEFSQMYFSLPN